MAGRTNAIRLSGKTWGAATSDLRKLYTAFVLSCAEFAAAGWMTGTAPSNLEHLEIAQRRGCRVVTGCLRSTPAAALEREADQLPFALRRRQLAAVAVERHLRDVPEDPLQSLLTEVRPPLRLYQDRGWADTGLRVSAEAGLEGLPREPMTVVPETAPWETPPTRISFGSTLCRPTSRSDAPETSLAAAQDTLRNLPPAEVTVFTDGSAASGLENQGGGAVVLRGSKETKRLRVPAGRYTSSYRAELSVLAGALRFLRSATRAWRPRRVLICTDSQSSQPSEDWRKDPAGRRTPWPVKSGSYSRPSVTAEPASTCSGCRDTRACRGTSVQTRWRERQRSSTKAVSQPTSVQRSPACASSPTRAGLRSGQRVYGRDDPTANSEGGPE